MLIGKEAPDFRATACNEDGSFVELNLSDYRGKKYVVLFFYVADFAFVDASELVSLSNRVDEFTKRDTQILAVSCESQFAHRGWRNTSKSMGGIEKVQFPMVADVSKEISQNYDVLAENSLPCRGVFIIDKGGVVKFEMRNAAEVGRSVDEIIRVLDAILHHESTGRVCPANWSSGKPDMVPSPE